MFVSQPLPRAVVRGLGLVVLFVNLVAMTGCRSVGRDSTIAELVGGQDEVLQEILDSRTHTTDTTLARVQTKLADSLRLDTPNRITIDMLVLSGGGEYGAFGTGVLAGWGEIEDPAFTRPEFDVVTGVSTGALIAPFALAGESDDIEKVQGLYSEIRPDLLRTRGLIPFLPKKPALYKNDKLVEMIELNITPEVIQECERAFSEHRVVVVASTDLDLGYMRTWDIGYEFSKLETYEQKKGRLQQLLLASSAIPAAFPPILVDGHLHTDGGAARMLFVQSSVDESVAQIRRIIATYPELEHINLRLWVIINKKLLIDPELTPLTWTGVAKRSLGTLVQTSVLDQLEQMRTMARVLNEEVDKVSAEFRFLAIPQNEELVETEKMFDSALVAQLIDLGVAIGRDPSNWQTEIRREQFFERNATTSEE